MFLRYKTKSAAQPVKGVDGVRKCKGWTFHYGPHVSNTPGRAGATEANPMPASRRGGIKPEFYTNNALLDHPEKAQDPMFYLFEMLPVNTFWDEVTGMTNEYRSSAPPYGCGMNRGGSHRCDEVELHELVRWFGAHVLDGVIGYSSGAIWQRWKGDICRSKEISDCMTFERYIQIKRVMHFANNKAPECDKTSPRFLPEAKVQFVIKTLCENVNRISTADNDMCGDETTWASQSPGPSGTTLMGRVGGKPGVTKGGQCSVLSDATRCRPRAYVFRYGQCTNATCQGQGVGMHHKHKQENNLVTASGGNEVLVLLRKLKESEATPSNLHITLFMFANAIVVAACCMCGLVDVIAMLTKANQKPHHARAGISDMEHQRYIAKIIKIS